MSKATILTDNIRGGNNPDGTPIGIETKLRYTEDQSFDNDLDIPNVKKVNELVGEASVNPLPLFSVLISDTDVTTVSSPGPGQGVIAWNQDQFSGNPTHLFVSLTDSFGSYYFNKATEFVAGDFIYLHTESYGVFQRYLITAVNYNAETDPLDDWMDYTVVRQVNGIVFDDEAVVNLIFKSAGSGFLKTDGTNTMDAPLRTTGDFSIKDSSELVSLLITAGIRYLVAAGGDADNPIVDYSNASDGSIPGGKAGLGINTQGVSGRYGRLLFNLLATSRNYQFPDKDIIVAGLDDIAAAIVGIYNDRGNFTPSGSYPSTGGSGTSGAILKGNVWTISGLGSGVTATMGAIVVQDGDTVRALINTPGNTDANWAAVERNIGYVPENVANKTTGTGSLSTSNTLYPSENKVKANIDSQSIKSIPFTATGDALTYTFAIAHGLSGTPTYYDIQSISADSFGITSISADGTNIYANYSIAPRINGANNISLIATARI